MKKTLILGMAALSFAAAAEVSTTWYGHGQIQGVSGNGVSTDPNSGYPTTANLASSLRAALGEVRMGAKMSNGNVYSVFEMRADGGAWNPTPVYMYAGYKAHPMFDIKAGYIKAAYGMDYTTSGNSLDQIGRSTIDGNLVLGMVQGFLVSGAHESGFGYDLGYYNNSNTANAFVDKVQAGVDNVMSLRLKYDIKDMLHVEASYGLAGDAVDKSATERGDATYYAVGVKYFLNDLTIKAEYLAAENDKVAASKQEGTGYYAHVDYKMGKIVPMVRYYAGNYKVGTTTDTEITNIYVGATYNLEENASLKANYIIVGGDDREDTTKNHTFSGYTANAFIAQYQVKW